MIGVLLITDTGFRCKGIKEEEKKQQLFFIPEVFVISIYISCIINVRFVHPFKISLMIKLQLIGHLGRDVIRREVNGAAVLGFPVATTERFRNAAGVLQERTTWVDCSLWERDNMAPYLQQGTMVYLEGTPTADAYVSQQTGQLVGAIRLRVHALQLLGRKEEERRRVAGPGQPDVPGAPDEDGVTDDAPF